MNSCRVWLAKPSSNGITISSCTPSPAISSALTSRLVSSFGAASGRTTRSGCGSNVRTASLPEITSRWPRWTPSNSPTAIRRGRGSPSMSVMTRIRRRSLAFAQPVGDDRLQRPVGERLGKRDQPALVGQPAHARQPALDRGAIARPARVVGTEPNLGDEAERVVQGENGSGAASATSKPRSAAGAAARSRRRRARRSASGRKFPRSIRSRSPPFAASPRAPRSGRPQPHVRRLDSIPGSSERVGAPPADLDGRVRRRPLPDAPVGRVSSPSGTTPVSTISPSGRRCSIRRRTWPSPHSSWAAPSGTAAPASPDRPGPATDPSRTDRASRSGRLYPAPSHRRTPATTSCEVTPAGLS